MKLHIKPATPEQSKPGMKSLKIDPATLNEGADAYYKAGLEAHPLLSAPYVDTIYQEVLKVE